MAETGRNPFWVTCSVSILVALILLTPACARSEDRGLLAEDDENAFTRAVPLVVDAKVVSESVVALRDDPGLPADWESNPTLSSLVKDGVARRKWKLAIETWIKGDSDAVVHAFRPVGSKGPGVSVWNELEDEGLPDIEVGATYRFWLDPNPDLRKDYFLSRARL